MDIILQENEMSADQQAFQVAMSAVQEAEEEVVDLHGQYFAHRDKMDKMLIPLYQMTNEVDYDVDGEWLTVHPYNLVQSNKLSFFVFYLFIFSIIFFSNKYW